jgi:hypothetical protein
VWSPTAKASVSSNRDEFDYVGEARSEVEVTVTEMLADFIQFQSIVEGKIGRPPIFGLD